tara:strand:- start:567 stop:899 length:333 start_codon:yes stop_codon:yes gene_type:complete
MKSQLMFIWARILLFISKPLGQIAERMDNYAVHLAIQAVQINKPKMNLDELLKFNANFEAEKKAYIEEWMPSGNLGWPEGDVEAYHASIGVEPVASAQAFRRKARRKAKK